MNILFDHQTFSQQTYGGISRYYTELINGINRTGIDKAYLALIFSNNVHLREAGIKTRSFFPKKNIPKKLHTIYKINEIYNIRKLKEIEYDIFHATYYDPYFLPYLKGRPFVITFLDMIHEKFGHKYDELAYDGTITKQKIVLAKHAQRIIAISESTKLDIVNLLDVDPSKIEVIHLGSSLVPKKLEIIDNSFFRPYLLFVGNRRMYKNFNCLLKSISHLLTKYKIRLVCAGGGEFNRDELEIIGRLKVIELVEYCPINDDKLSLLYQHATAFIFPSLYEGFGIPILEAFACGCPCIVSNNSSLPEVAGDAALYISPHQSESMAYAVESIITDSQLRQDLIEKGYIRLRSFSWKHTVSETLKLYSSLI